MAKAAEFAPLPPTGRRATGPSFVADFVSAVPTETLFRWNLIPDVFTDALVLLRAALKQLARYFCAVAALISSGPQVLDFPLSNSSICCRGEPSRADASVRRVRWLSLRQMLR